MRWQQSRKGDGGKPLEECTGAACVGVCEGQATVAASLRPRLAALPLPTWCGRH